MYIQVHKVHLLIRVKVTFTPLLTVTGEGQRSQKMNYWPHLTNYYIHRYHT